ncbi:MAG: hypothetical protein P1V97_27395 [Planctomycetota bacterium]|nr:hypothetical protein [Planctomycetota bacterium]
MKNNDKNNSNAGAGEGQENFEVAGILRQHFLQDPPPKNLVENVTKELRKQEGVLPVIDQRRLRPLKSVFLRSVIVVWPLIAVLCFFVSSGERRRAPKLHRPVVQQDIQGTPETWIRFDLLERLSQSGHIDYDLGLGTGNGYVYQAYWDGEDPHEWWVVAVPEVDSDSKGRFYLINQAGEIRYEEGKIPTFSSPVLGER